ncbi:DJ-1 family glyoxalase III [[Clostridium] polysaccharolyticum]|uniref:4-methyl-5(B-hydroxyethyl)-thiazole monophosphate biosynthesis n=1 Tax=[Clostridium] polysaccharolyticum TaxID=29364 RepID=A0A1I0FT02_9FIRM|nr:DJ-1 family glyoxalase III [[Clostridium] polysaccharolyticum]SET61513.1 4-methyl-5(b-hydroxyethyl)-thiazole monophosphate biosynthesis [[Clostridium] polysaccharolyticum]
MAKVYIFLANGFEEIEGLTVVDLLRRAQINAQMVSIEEGKQVTGSHNIKVEADCLFKDAKVDEADMLVLPGGMPGTTNLLHHPLLIEKIKEFHKNEKWLAAICAAPSVLGACGVLTGKKACCYPGFEEKLLGAAIQYEAVIQDGHVITSRGMGVAIDFALKIIEVLVSEEKAQEIKESVIYQG